MDTPTPETAITVSFPPALLPRVGGRAKVVVTGCTVREIVDTLDQRFPGLRFNLCYETGQLRPYVNIFLEGENIRYLQNLDTPVSPGATLAIFPSVAGG
jgi:molybdopterin synthase sulfur carrier subunit